MNELYEAPIFADWQALFQVYPSRRFTGPLVQKRYNLYGTEMQTILVIDDDENLRDTIAVMLEQEGFRAVMAGDGKTGFDKAVTLKPDLLLVDLRLPGMSGVEICKQLRAGQVKTPIIVLSAAGDEVDKVLLLEIGADDYVVKPFGTRELRARIRAVLRRASPDSRKVVRFAEI